jgi:hypothetical protein
VIRQRKNWITATDPAFPSAADCSMSTTGWDTHEVVAQNVVNGTGRPLFAYNATDPLKISEIHTSLYVDVNPGTRPVETSLFTTVFLRNQNRAPIARFSAVRSGTSIVLNGSESEDPEERALYYEWYKPGSPDPEKIGEGIVYIYDAPPGSNTIFLHVKDQAGLSNDAPEKTVCMPGGGC